MLYYRAASNEAGHVRAGHGNILSMKERANILEENNEIKKSRFIVKDDVTANYLTENIQKIPRASVLVN